MSGPILICYDGSEDSKRAVDAAAELFGARHAVVVNVAPTVTFAESMAMTSSVVPGGTFEELNQADARRCAEDGVEYARSAGMDAEARATVASPTWRGIAEIAGEIDASVIVIGSRGLSALREIARGSVSHDVATHAGRPVLIVPPATT